MPAIDHPAATLDDLLARRDANLRRPICTATGWSDLDVRAVDTARLLAADAVQKAGSGHPGTAMSLAPAAYLLFQQLMRNDPADPLWLGRDRFILSCGHSSLTLYVQLFLAGYGMELDDLKALRTWGSQTPGHPEVHHTPGVEITTGPLGSGLASAVGMAMAQRRQRGLLDPESPQGESPFDHRVYVVCSDGDVQEGVSAEACSLAGHQELGSLICIYDQNEISIEDDTDVSFSEDVGKRFEAYGWHVETVDWRSSGDHGNYVEDIDALTAAVKAAQEESVRPSLIILRTVIAWPSPNRQDTGKSHGSALGQDEIEGTRELLGFPAGETFTVEPGILEHTRQVRDRGAGLRSEWQSRFESWRSAQPERAALLDRLLARRLPDGLADALPSWEPDAKGVATRSASGKVLNALGPIMPELWGGSADLAESNNTTIDSDPSFLPERHQTQAWPGNPYGRNLHFGIREHGMGMILNGIALEGLTRPYGGTFLVFSDYMRGAVRLAALQEIPVTFVWTHDSIGLGEDGPTHQPIEHLASLRAIPGLDVVRPADANETAEAWRAVLERDRTAGLMLTRQTVPVLDRSGARGDVSRGAYVLSAGSNPEQPDVLVVATGSEVAIALEGAEQLEAQGVATRVVSMPCREWFEEQDDDYQDSVIPPSVRARVSIEAGVAQGWRDVVGDAGRCISIEHFGASAAYARLYQEFGLTAEAVVAAARDSMTQAEAGVGPGSDPRMRHRRRESHGTGDVTRPDPSGENPMDAAARGVESGSGER